MKRIIAALICAITVLSLFSCAAPQSKTTGQTDIPPLVIIGTEEPEETSSEAAVTEEYVAPPVSAAAAPRRVKKIPDAEMCLNLNLGQARRSTVGLTHLEGKHAEVAIPDFNYECKKLSFGGYRPHVVRYGISDNGLRTNLLYTFRHKGAYQSLYKDEWWFEDMDAFCDAESFFEEMSEAEGREELSVSKGSIVPSKKNKALLSQRRQKQIIVNVFDFVNKLGVTKDEFVRANDARAKKNLDTAGRTDFSSLSVAAIPTFSDATVDALFSSSSGEGFSRRVRCRYSFADPQHPRTFYNEAELEALVMDAFGPGLGSYDVDKANERKELRELIAEPNKNGALARHFEAVAQNQENSIKWLYDQYDYDEDYGLYLLDKKFEPGHDLMINCALDIVIPLFNSLFPDDPDLRIQTDEFWDALCYTTDELLTLPAVTHDLTWQITDDPYYKMILSEVEA